MLSDVAMQVDVFQGAHKIGTKEAERGAQRVNAQRAGDSLSSSNSSVIVGGIHTVSRTGPNNTYFV